MYHKPFKYINKVGYFLKSGVTSILKDFLKSNVTDDETEYVLASLRIPFIEQEIWGTGRSAKHYSYPDIENLVKNNLYKVRDLITMRRAGLKPSNTETVYDPRSIEEIEDEIRRKNLASRKTVPDPDTDYRSPEENMDYVSTELLRKGDVYRS